eukprot:CAMPEP_0202458284 /NCGR_PEP_ID=MMETSP1360-20130828/23964_1 /ASSEMBLY_ACC=CAM_ASM_000848 /TAXON_ID=515479 /ORGANISM="Licmophora paradoxa, Strain CCMP2313" /LENGTH=360 /DNA_ID=CAMNT_0049078755 /DNA_START=49 /DNA_END=1131 /DNA_ORIENTATION=-
MVTSNNIPSELLISFFEESTKSLIDLKLDGDGNGSSRDLILDAQKRCLTRILSKFPGVSEQEIQQELRRLGSGVIYEANIEKAMKEMNDTARLTYCRLTLQQWICYPPVSDLTKTGQLPRKIIMEFLGLVQGSLQLQIVKDYLVTGKPMFDCMDQDLTKKFPQERLEWIQRILMMSLGYDADFGTEEIKRIFFTGNGEDVDPELLQLFQKTISEMQVGVTNATLQIQETQLNDTQEGGVTRIVSVSYSENDVSSTPFHETSIHDDSVQEEQLQMARQAAILQQSILAELLQMDEETRRIELERAKHASQGFQAKAMKLPPGEERVAFMTSISPSVQRQLLMYKIWTSTTEKHGGKPPTMH